MEHALPRRSLLPAPNDVDVKILLTVHQFLPEYFAGTEIIVLGIAQELRRRGHAVTVATGFPDPRPLADAERVDRYTYEGLDVVRFRYAAHPMGDQRVIAELAYDNRLFAGVFDGLLAELAPDVVHFVHLARLSAAVIDPCVRRGIPTVFTATDFWTTCPYGQLRLSDDALCAGPDATGANCVRHFAATFATRRGAVGRMARHAPDWLIGAGVRVAGAGLPFAPPILEEVRALVRRPSFVRDQVNRVDRVLAPSHVMRRALVDAGIAAERVRVLPYGIDVRGFTRSTERGAGPALRLGFVGSLVEHKGLHVLLDALGRLDPALAVRLDVHGPAGTSAAGQAYHRTIAARAAADPRIRLHGPFANDRAAAVLSSLDVLVVPSTWRENTPLVVYEAFAAGCPVVASDVDGIAEVVRHDVDGLLFPCGDAAALAACIQRIVDDRPLVQRLAERTRPPRSVAQHVTALEAIYDEVIAAHYHGPDAPLQRAVTPSRPTGPTQTTAGMPKVGMPTVQILLSTYQGEAFLRPLLESLDAQTYPALELLVRDDGSADGTLALLEGHAGRIPREVRPGAHLGLPATFFQLLRDSRPDGDLFAFCDQDDVWLPDKVARAVDMLRDVDPAVPALYCGRAQFTDRALRPLGLSDLPRRGPSFQHALMQNIAPGCTMVMNRAARDLLAHRAPEGVFMHDAWAYLLVAAFGTVLYDPEPRVLYRQHGANAVGRPRGLSMRLARLARDGWTWPHLRQAVQFHRLYGARLDGEERRALERLVGSQATLRHRLGYALTAEVYREQLRDDIAFRLLFVVAGRLETRGAD